MFEKAVAHSWRSYLDVWAQIQRTQEENEEAIQILGEETSDQEVFDW